MNKRARNRLIIAAAIIVVIGGAGFLLAMQDSQPINGVAELLAQGDTAVGLRMKVTGTVIGESWNGQANPMRFEIKDESTATASPQTLKVEYSGVAPGGFGDKTKAVCPTKYQTAQAMTVDQILADKAVLDQTVKLAGYVTGSVSSNGFTMSSRLDGGKTVDVRVSAALPDGVGKGAYVELTGELLKDGTYRASKVDVKKKAQ
jgi:cytochrome c-type biogenesis protein CcmE